MGDNQEVFPRFRDAFRLDGYVHNDPQTATSSSSSLVAVTGSEQQNSVFSLSGSRKPRTNRRNPMNPPPSIHISPSLAFHSNSVSPIDCTEARTFPTPDISPVLIPSSSDMSGEMSPLFSRFSQFNLMEPFSPTSSFSLPGSPEDSLLFSTSSLESPSLDSDVSLLSPLTFPDISLPDTPDMPLQTPFEELQLAPISSSSSASASPKRVHRLTRVEKAKRAVKVLSRLRITPVELLCTLIDAQNTDFAAYQNAFYRQDSHQAEAVLEAIYGHPKGRARHDAWLPQDSFLGRTCVMITEEFEKAKENFSMTTLDVTAEFLEDFDIQDR